MLSVVFLALVGFWLPLGGVTGAEPTYAPNISYFYVWHLPFNGLNRQPFVVGSGSQ